MQELENGISPDEPEIHRLVSILHAMALLRLSYPLIMLIHLARGHPLLALILHIPIEPWILSLTTLLLTLVNSVRSAFQSAFLKQSIF